MKAFLICVSLSAIPALSKVPEDALTVHRSGSTA
jgi:hypothetical protein